MAEPNAESEQRSWGEASPPGSQQVRRSATRGERRKKEKTEGDLKIKSRLTA